jgi:hypothetical protein
MPFEVVGEVYVVRPVVYLSEVTRTDDVLLQRDTLEASKQHPTVWTSDPLRTRLINVLQVILYLWYLLGPPGVSEQFTVWRVRHVRSTVTTECHVIAVWETEDLTERQVAKVHIPQQEDGSTVIAP